MGVVSELEKKVEGAASTATAHLPHHQQQKHNMSMPNSAKQIPPATARHLSLKIRTDARANNSSSGGGNHDLPQQPKTAGIIPSPMSIPRPETSQQNQPTSIKRNTSFSQRIHNLLHRDKSGAHANGPSRLATTIQTPHRKQSPAIAAAVAGASDSPAIGFRTPQTHSAEGSSSENNTPPQKESPHSSSNNITAYYAQRNFEPTPADSVFAVSNVSLRSVQRHGSQIRDSIHRENRISPAATVTAAPAAVPGKETTTADNVCDRLAGTSIHSASSRESNQQIQKESAANKKSATLVSGSSQEPAAAAAVPTATSHSVTFEDNKRRLAAGTTRDAGPPPSSSGAGTCHKKLPIYSTHKASLKQFGRQTKVIGEGTGGTVRLLQSVEIDNRPASLRSGPPSSHHEDDDEHDGNNSYAPSEHRLFAVKEFRKRRADETPRAYMKKVTSEFCIGSSIHQENVIETLDLIFEGERVYEIMEFCPHDLFTFVAKGNLDLEETFCWFKQVCQGVQYLHKIGIAHRDLKLENCLLTERGIIKIIDFGCATVFKTPFQKEPSKVVGICGSDPYIAPEVLLSKRQIPYYAQVADIWSVGIIYMCMTLLKFPWKMADTEVDRNYGSYIREWPRGKDKLFAQLPKLRHDGQKVIEGMVYPDVKGRYQMDQVLSSRWMKEVDVCHTSCQSQTHSHHMKMTVS